MRDGQSVDTTMSFSALDGLPMGTRCGTLDPGVILFLLRDGWSVDRIEDLLYKRSGLLGISGVSNDVRRCWRVTARWRPRRSSSSCTALFVRLAR